MTQTQPPEMTPAQALSVLVQAADKFVGSGQDHRLIAQAVQILTQVVQHEADPSSNGSAPVDHVPVEDLTG